MIKELGRKSVSPSRSTRQPIDGLFAFVLSLLYIVFLTVTLVTYWKLSSDIPSYLEPATATIPIDVLQHRFPIHVTDNDVEEIQHPGIQLADVRTKLAKMLPSTMKVPQFFDDAFGHYYGNTTIRDYLGKHGQTLITPEQAASIGSFTTVKDKVTGVAMAMETIYCSIATYRDPECVNTVEYVYQRAKYPERIRVAIIDQHAITDQETKGTNDNNMTEPVCSQPKVPCEQDPNHALCKYKHLIDIMNVDARLAIGPVFARHLAHRYYRGEYFAMQVDSHVEFVQDWDVDVIDQWRSTKNEMAVLSTYLDDIVGSIDPVTHKSIHIERPIMCESDFEERGTTFKHLRHGTQPDAPVSVHGQPSLHPYWAAGFSFARGHFVIQVPYDQYLPLVFQGEEISMGIRGFTYGYDYYAPERNVCYHMYGEGENEAKRASVPLFWEHASAYPGTGKKAMRRLNTIIKMFTYTEPWPRDEMEKYGLGQIRRPEKFYKTFGIHVETETVEHHLCRFVNSKQMMQTFLPAMREDRMGLDYEKIDYVFVDPEPKQKDEEDEEEEE